MAEARKLQKEQLRIFFAGVADISHKCFRKQVLLNRIDTKNFFRKKKEAEEKEKAERKLREEEEQRRRLEEEKIKQEEEERRKKEEAEKRLREEEQRRKLEEEKIKQQEEEKRKKEEAEKRLREEEQRHKLEEEKRKEVEKDEENHCEVEQKELGGKLEEKRENTIRKTATTLPLTSKATLENLHRSSAVVSAKPPQRKKKTPPESRAAPGHGRGGGASQNEHIYANGVGEQMEWRENGHHLGADFKRGCEEDPGDMSHFSSVEDSNQKYPKPITESFEPPVSVGLKRPQRRLMKIRSNPLSDSSGEMMVVSNGPTNGLHAPESDDIHINGYMFDGAPVTTNGHSVGSPDDVIEINGSGILMVGGGLVSNEHAKNKIVLNDYDYDDTVSPTAGDMVEEIYDTTVPVVPNGTASNELAPNSSSDNIYDKVGNIDNSADEPVVDTHPTDYCEPITLKVHTSSPDFNETPAMYRDPASVMDHPPPALGPSKISENQNQETCEDRPYELVENDLETCEDRPYELVEVGVSMPDERIYENSTKNKLISMVDTTQKQCKINAHSPLRMSYFTGISPIDDEDYGDTDTLPPVDKHSPKPSPSHSHRRNGSLDSDVFLPGVTQSSSSSSIYNRTQHHPQLHRRHGTKLKKSSSSSVDQVPSVSSQSSVVGGLQEALNSVAGGGVNGKPKSPESPKKCGRRGLKKSDSESSNQLWPEGGVKANPPSSPKRHAHRKLKKCVSDAPSHPVYSHLDTGFSPTAPLPPIPTEAAPRSNMPLPPPPSPPQPPPSPYSVPGAVMKSAGKSKLEESDDYDYIGSGTLKKAIGNQAIGNQASPYLEFQHQVATGSPQPYTPPIQRKNKKLCKSASSVDQPVPPPVMPHKSHAKSSNSVPPEDPILSRPPAIPPVILSGHRPPAPLPPEAVMQESSDKHTGQHHHKPLSHARSLYTPGSSTSASSINIRPHPPLTRGGSAAVLSSVPESHLSNHGSSSPSPPSTSPNRSPRIPPRFPRNHATPPSTAPPPAPPMSAKVSPSPATPPPNPSSSEPLPPPVPSRDVVANGSNRPPPPPPGPPPSCTSTSCSPKTPSKKQLNSAKSLIEISDKKASQPPAGSNVSSLASSFTHNSLISQIHAAVHKQQPRKETESATTSTVWQSKHEEGAHSKAKSNSDSPPVLKTKLRSISSVELNENAVGTKATSSSNSSSSPSLASSATKPAAGPPPTSRPSDNSMPEWKRALLEKRQQQQLQKQQSKVSSVFFNNQHKQYA